MFQLKLYQIRNQDNDFAGNIIIRNEARVVICDMHILGDNNTPDGIGENEVAMSYGVDIAGDAIVLDSPNDFYGLMAKFCKLMEENPTKLSLSKITSYLTEA